MRWAALAAGVLSVPGSLAAQSSVTPRDLPALLRQKPVVLDTRVPNERFDKERHFVRLKCDGCVTVFGWYDPQMHLPEGVIKELSHYKNRAILAVCERGIRSSGAATFLVSRGFREVYTLKGGLRRVPSQMLEVNSRRRQ